MLRMMRCAVMYVVVSDCCVNLLACAIACAQFVVVVRARDRIAVNVDVYVCLNCGRVVCICVHVNSYAAVVRACYVVVRMVVRVLVCARCAC